MTPISAPTPTTPLTVRAGLTASRRMVALDVDGTLTKEGGQDVPASTREAITEAREAGHTVVLASGRSLIGLLPIARKLGLPGPIVASNGAVVAYPHPGVPGFALDSDHEKRLDVDQVVVAALNQRLDGLQIAVEAIGHGYWVSSRFPDELLNGRQVPLPRAQMHELPSPRIALHAPGVHALIEPLRRAGLTVNQARPDWIDVTPGGVSKATALENLRERLGIAPEYTVAVGDGLNDLEMLAWARRGVAMGHAPQKVRDAAGEVTGTLEEAGVVDVLRSLEPPDRGLARQINAAVERWLVDGDQWRTAQEDPAKPRLAIRAWRQGLGPSLASVELCTADGGQHVALLPSGTGATLHDVVLAVLAAGHLPRMTPEPTPRPAWRFDANGPTYTLAIHER